MGKILEVRNIYKYYGNLAANEDVNLSVERGSVHAIIGENGAGKSTLMNIIAGVIQPSSGDILIDGKIQRFHNANDATAAGVGMVQQEFMLFEKLTVLENIIMGHEAHKAGGLFLDMKESERRVREICQEYGFHFDLHARVSSLPIVIQQQVEIVKVLYKKADIIVLDEPTAVLPPQEVEGLFKAIRFLIKQNKTVIFITHKLREVLEISDNITIMKLGKVVGSVAAKDANETMLTNMMVGREVILNVEKHPPKSDETVLSVRNLVGCDHRNVEKVKNVSFDLHKGEILGIVGIAGNGQNELVNFITGMASYKSGTISFCGEPLKQNSPRENRLKGIGYVPQDRALVGASRTSTLIENTIMGKHLTDFKKSGLLMDYEKGATFTDEVVKTFSVKAQSIDDPASSLSGGNLQKLIVGREFSQQSPLLIIEDPTRGIDVGSIEFIWNKIIKQSEKQGVSVLLITYDLNEAMTLADRILIMYGGEICKEMEGPGYDEKEIGLYMLGGRAHEETCH